MTNPNNCDTCDHKRIPDGGHCYMFRQAPTDVCMQHTGHDRFQMPATLADALVLTLTHPAIGTVEVELVTTRTCLSCGAKTDAAGALPCMH